ncbi:MAG: DUF2505 domain-containing protein [Nocardioidaceae bacterium]|nr:DUF2505 domain-containing protein [Nocardioidaceae bacterium]
MKFHRALAYQATPEEVFAMIADPAFRRQVAQAQNVASIEVTIQPRGDGLHVGVDQEQNTAGLPAIAKKIAGDTTRAIIAEEWSDHASGDYQITAPGKPTKAIGTVSIKPDGEGANYVLDLEVSVKVPLIGGKLEKVMSDQIADGLQIEHRVGMAWLGGDR